MSIVDRIMNEAQPVGIFLVLTAFGVEVFGFAIAVQNYPSQRVVTQAAQVMENAALAMIAGTGVAFLGAFWRWAYPIKKEKPE